MMGDKWIIHPSLSVLVLYFVVTQQLLLYSVLIGSLVVHELGHLCVAKLLKVKLRKITFYPIGAQIIFMPASNSKMLCIILGGPTATVILCTLAIIFQLQHVTYFQLIILLFNGLPIWPLDGGKIVYYSLKCMRVNIHYEQYMSMSLLLALSFCASMLLVQAPVFIVIAAIILVIESYRSYQSRKYAQALENIVEKKRYSRM